MTIFEIFAALITLAAVFSYLNFRFLKLPTTIGLMVMALVGSLILIWTGRYSPTVFEAPPALSAGNLSQEDGRDELDRYNRVAWQPVLERPTLVSPR